MTNKRATGKIAYIMSRFPHLPETFILREMVELKKLGWQIGLYPLLRQRELVVHNDAMAWMEVARYSPLLSWKLIQANLKMWLKRPVELLRIFWQVIRGNIRDANFFVRAMALLPKAVYLAQQIEQDGVEHVHAHYATHPALVAWVIHRLTGVSYSITVHAHDIFVRQAMLATKLREAEFIIAISDYNRRFLSEQVGQWIEEKTVVVHCGIDPELYGAERVAPRSHETFEVVNIGSLQPYKGQSYLVEACALLRDRGIPIHCQIIGGGSQVELRAMISRLELTNVVQLVGPLDQHSVAQALAHADCYIQPSVVTPSGKMEGIPVSLMEALATGLPVIATQISGVPELVRHMETGYLAREKDAPALANALEYVYQHPEEAQQWAAAGRALVLNEFNLQKNVEQLSTIFLNHLGRKTQPLNQTTLMTALVDELE